MSRLADAVVVVTGGGSGLGRTYCESLAHEGARVVVADIDGDSAAAVAGALDGQAPPRAVAVAADVTSEAGAEAIAQTALDAFQRIDVLVNNAGSYPHVAFEQIGYDDWRRVMSVNLDSVFLCSRAVLGQMKAQGEGSIINVATNLVWTGLAGMVHYVAAKAGVVGFTRAFAREVGGYGIRVNAIAPGAVVPDVVMTDAARERIDAIVNYQCLQRPQRSRDLVGTVLFLASPESAFISGQVITVDGGLTTH
ncbi:MAG: SDR family oxidoreductase [Actinobacteria bacterium]|nr:MAG: SDR family oxidoreductase [Actinomycetota bacterium]